MNLSNSINGNESNENNARHFNKRKVLKCIKTNCKVQYNFNMGICQTKDKNVFMHFELVTYFLLKFAGEIIIRI